MIERTPVEIFSPGELINDEIDARWSQAEFAEVLERSFQQRRQGISMTRIGILEHEGWPWRACKKRAAGCSSFARLACLSK
jgi:hypothetical protein